MQYLQDKREIVVQRRFLNIPKKLPRQFLIIPERFLVADPTLGAFQIISNALLHLLRLLICSGAGGIVLAHHNSLLL